jgi:hypothetical protein
LFLEILTDRAKLLSFEHKKGNFLNTSLPRQGSTVNSPMRKHGENGIYYFGRCARQVLAAFAPLQRKFEVWGLKKVFF